MNFGALNIQDPNVWQTQQNLMPPQGLPMAMPQPQAPQMMPPRQQMPMPVQQPMQMPQITAGPSNPSPHGPIGDVLNQLIATKQQQEQQGPTMAQQILAMRFQPTQDDALNADKKNLLAILSPDSFKTTSPFEQAQQRTTMQLAPYTTSLDLATKQAGLQEAQVKAQYAQPLAEADVKLKNAQAYMAGGGMFSQGAAGGGPAGAPQLNGQAYLQTLPPQIATQVKALAEGRMQFPGGFALKSPYWQQMISAVSTYDPTFDAVNYNARAKTRNDFTSGKSAQSINGLNTVIGHLQSLSDAADALHNGPLPSLNNAQNVGLNMIGDPRVKNFDATKKAVVDELTRVYRGSGGSEGDIKTWSEQINSANSPEQLHSVIATIGDLLESKVNALGEQYKQGLGTTSQPIELMTPHAQNSLNVLRQRAGSPVQSTVPSGVDPALIQELKRRGKM